MSRNRLLSTLLLLMGILGAPAEAQPCADPHDAPVISFTLTNGLVTSPGVYGAATLLRDGRVLITGGLTWVPPGASFQSLSTAQLYDPKTGLFTPTASMGAPRYSHQAILLHSGKVLIIGGRDYGHSPTPQILSSAELYDPRTGTFTATGTMTNARFEHNATLLHNGTVLVTGGGGGNAKSAETYDPETGTFAATGLMTDRRRLHQASRLNDGRVLISGGHNWAGITAVGLDTAEIYDPKTGTFSPTGSMSLTRTVHTATVLHDGKVLLVGGINIQGGDLYSSPDIATAELYDPRTGVFATVGSLGTARDSHSATLLDEGLVLVAGGMDTASASFFNSAELYDPHTGLFTPTSPMLQPREGHCAVLLRGGQVLIVGGDNENPPIPQAELFSLEHDFRR